MKKIIKITLIILILILCLSTLTGCYDASGIENLAYVIALGIDKGDTNKLKLSLQITSLTSSEASSSGGGSSQYSQASVISVDCATIDEGLSLINSYISKKVNLSHCKALIISEDLAYDGVSEYVFTFANNLEIRPNSHVLISKCSANDFLKNFEPSLESISARYYELILNSTSYAGFTENIYLYNFYEDILSTTREATAILVNLNDKSNHKNSGGTDSINGNFLAGETPIESQSKNEAMGIAIFSKDKLVGELNNLETLCHLIVCNKLDTATITVPNPLEHDKNISLSIRLYNKTSHNVDLVNNYPFISCNIEIAATVSTMDYKIDLSDKENLESIEETLNQYLTENIRDYLYKTSKDFGTDIVGFGKSVVPKYLTWKSWSDSDWLNNYKNAIFKVNVKSTVESGYLYTKI